MRTAKVWLDLKGVVIFNAGLGGVEDLRNFAIFFVPQIPVKNFVVPPTKKN